jgi:hypothetical protein
MFGAPLRMPDSYAPIAHGILRAVESDVCAM